MKRPGGHVLGVGASAAVLAISAQALGQAVGRFPDPAAPGAANPQPSATGFPSPAAPSPPPDDPPRAVTWPYPASSTAQPALPSNQPAPTPAFGSGLYPAVLPYREGQPVPQGYRLEERRNTGLSTGGFVTLGLAYGIGLGYGAANKFEDGTGWLAVPLVGPWAAIGAQEIKCNKRSLENDCVEQALGGAERITFMTVDGLIQAVGLTLVFVGVGVKTSELVRTDVASLRLELKPRFLGMAGDF